MFIVVSELLLKLLSDFDLCVDLDFGVDSSKFSFSFGNSIFLIFLGVSCFSETEVTGVFKIFGDFGNLGVLGVLGVLGEFLTNGVNSWIRFNSFGDLGDLGDLGGDFGVENITFSGSINFSHVHSYQYSHLKNPWKDIGIKFYGKKLNQHMVWEFLRLWNKKEAKAFRRKMRDKKKT